MELIKNGNRIPIKYIASNDKKGIEILESGQVVLYEDPIYDVGDNYKTLKTYIMRYIDDFLSPLPKDVYIRVNDHKEDFEHLKNGTHRGSINHFNNTPEFGLSVAKSLEWHAEYIYYVQGEKSGTGTDGESVLKIDTIKLISKKPMSLKQFNYNFGLKQVKKIKELGLSQDDFRLLKSMAYIIK